MLTDSRLAELSIGVARIGSMGSSLDFSTFNGLPAVVFSDDNGVNTVLVFELIDGLITGKKLRCGRYLLVQRFRHVVAAAALRWAQRRVGVGVALYQVELELGRHHRGPPNETDLDAARAFARSLLP